MKKIQLLDFFRTGKLDTVAVGMTQAAVFAELREPDHWINFDRGLNKQPFIIGKATIWAYGSIELFWLKPDSGLHMISFRVDALHQASSKIEIGRWIFRKNKGVSWTCAHLKAALGKMGISYQDTGLEIITRDNDGFKVKPFIKDDTMNHDPDNVFGTLVLKSGVQIRYGEDDYIIKIATGGAWAFKGSEQFIVW